MNQQHKKKLQATGYRLQVRGFTLIEFLVVLGIIVLLVPSIFGLIYSLLRQQGRIVALQEVKRQGDLVFNHMKVTIKNNAGAPYSDLAGTTAVCTSAVAPDDTFSTNTAIYFLDGSDVNSYFGYKLEGTSISYEKTGSAPTTLTNSAITVSNLVLGCERDSEFSPPLVNISYTITQPANSVSLNYKTLIKLNTH